MFGGNLRISLESILVMMLLIVMATTMSIVIVRGAESYERLVHTKQVEEDARIAVSFVTTMVKQNDRWGGVSLIENAVSGADALVIAHDGDLEGFKSYIFFYQGDLLVCLTDAHPEVDLSEKIVPLADFQMTLLDGLLTMEATYIESGNNMAIKRYVALMAP